MKQNRSTFSRVVWNLALVAGVLTITLVADPPAAKADEFPGPLEPLHRLHMRLRNQILHGGDHAARFHNGYRNEFPQRYPSQSYGPRYDRRSYRPPMRGDGYWVYPQDGYRYGRPYTNGYIVVSPGEIGFETWTRRPMYRDEYDRHDGCDRDGYRYDDGDQEDSRRRQDDRDYEDNN